MKTFIIIAAAFLVGAFLSFLLLSILTGAAKAERDRLLFDLLKKIRNEQAIAAHLLRKAANIGGDPADPHPFLRSRSIGISRDLVLTAKRLDQISEDIISFWRSI